MTDARGDRTIGAATRLATLLDQRVAVLHAAAILALLALFAAAAWFLTLEADEAWILLSAANAFGAAVPPTSALANPTVSTGGPYLLVQGTLALLTANVFVHRAVSLIAAAGLLFLVYATLRRLDHSFARAMAGTALMAAIPGFVLQAGLATGELLAVLILLAALLHWADPGSRSIGAAVITGLLLGLACATRINCVVAAAGLLTYALLAPSPSLRRVVHAAVAVVVAAVIAGSAMAFYYHLSAGSGSGGDAAYLSASTGVGTARKSVFQLAQNIDIFERFLPASLLAGIVGGWLALRVSVVKSPKPSGLDAAGVLLFAGLAMLCAWVLVAPIPHLRYLWPALVCLWLAGVILLLEAWRTRSPIVSMAIHGAVLATSGTAILLTILTVTSGESLVLVYQAIGSAPRTPLDRSHRFTAASNQAALASFMAARTGDTEFFALTEPAAYPLTYLSGRQVHAVSEMPRRSLLNAPRILLLQPADAAIWQPGPAFDLWRRRHAQLVFRSGDTIALWVEPDAPAAPSDTYVVGQSARIMD